MTTRRRAALILLLLILLAGLGLFAALATGSIHLSFNEVFAALGGADEGLATEVVVRLRLPRVLGAFACGGLLALAGTLMQVLLRNPLADPYVLGISGGAAVGTLLSTLIGAGGFLLNASAFVGAFAVMLLVFGLARGDGSWTQSRLLLAGVIVASGCGAVVSLILSIAPDHALHGMLFWLMGDAAQIEHPLPALIVLGCGLLLAMPLARDLNVLARGETQARALGVPVSAVRLFVYALAALLTATSVTTAGCIGFVGLVVPHLVRLAIGNDQRLLLPAATLAGGSLLTFADTLARTVIAPQQLPVGVLTAIIGVPLFLFLLSRQPGEAG